MIDRPRPSAPPRLGERTSGVLLHPTSLPGPWSIGDLGGEARRFVRWLAAAGQRRWQMLPVGPAGFAGSPYSAESAFAGDPLLVDVEPLAASGLVTIRERPGDRGEPVDREVAARFKLPLLREAAHAFAARASGAERDRFTAFCHEARGWLDDFALYTALKRASNGAPWSAWDPALALRDPPALARAARELEGDLRAVRFEQFIFAEQFAALRTYAAERGIGLVGDVPIFVAHDSADVWQRRALWKLDARGLPALVAGVPPDYFSRTGQRWGNPVYRWDVLAEDGYRFWIDRLRAEIGRFDLLRLDHFIGFVRAFEIPAAEPTAEHGSYVPGPGEPFFAKVRAALGDLPFIAEDLGAVTEEVIALRDRLQLPGMRVLQFAFGDDAGAPGFLPHAYERRTVAYTGTHDNDTIRGFIEDRGGEGTPRSIEQAARERAVALAYLDSDGSDFAWDAIRALLASVADMVIFPVQDILDQGSGARMNRPGTTSGNWTYRVGAGALTPDLAARLARLSRLYGRTEEDPRALTEPRSLSALDQDA